MQRTRKVIALHKFKMFKFDNVFVYCGVNWLFIIIFYVFIIFLDLFWCVASSSN